MSYEDFPLIVTNYSKTKLEIYAIYSIFFRLLQNYVKLLGYKDSISKPESSPNKQNSLYMII